MRALGYSPIAPHVGTSCKGLWCILHLRNIRLNQLWELAQVLSLHVQKMPAQSNPRHKSYNCHSLYDADRRVDSQVDIQDYGERYVPKMMPSPPRDLGQITRPGCIGCSVILWSRTTSFFVELPHNKLQRLRPGAQHDHLCNRIGRKCQLSSVVILWLDRRESRTNVEWFLASMTSAKTTRIDV